MARCPVFLTSLAILLCWTTATAFRPTFGMLKKVAPPPSWSRCRFSVRRTCSHRPYAFHNGVSQAQAWYSPLAHAGGGSGLTRYAKKTHEVDANFTVPTIAKVITTSFTILQNAKSENNAKSYSTARSDGNSSAHSGGWYSGIADLVGTVAKHFPGTDSPKAGQISDSSGVLSLNGTANVEGASQNRSTLTWIQETMRWLNPLHERNNRTQQASTLQLGITAPTSPANASRVVNASTGAAQSLPDTLWAAIVRVRDSMVTVSCDRAAVNGTHVKRRNVHIRDASNTTQPLQPQRATNASADIAFVPTPAVANNSTTSWFPSDLSTAGRLAVSTVLWYLPRGGSNRAPGNDTTATIGSVNAPAVRSGAVISNASASAPVADEVEDSTTPPLLRSVYSMLPWLTPTTDTRVDAVAQIIEQADANITITNSSHVPVVGPDLAIQAALAVNSTVSAQTFLSQIGLNVTLASLLQGDRSNAQIAHIDAVRALSAVVRYHPDSAVEIANQTDVVVALCEIIEQPLRAIETWLPLRSVEDRKRILTAQHEAVALVHRLLRSSDQATEVLQQHDRLRRALLSLVDTERASSTKELAVDAARSTWATKAVLELQQVKQGQAEAKKDMKTYRVRKHSNVTAVGEYDGLRTAQMARVAAWSLGGAPWRPRVPGQKGLRILSLDGGGTRGVLSIAFLKEIFLRANCPFKPYQMFDMICGTSTGGIIAALLGAERANLDEAEVLYDEFIDKIFAQRSNLRLVTEQAAYDGRDWEKILYDMCGDQLFVDSNQHDCARVFCISTMVNVNPPVPNLWRNYNYPPRATPRYPGASRVNTFTAIRATTAAPTFFTPVHWGSGLYCDGALVANNPTAIAMQEAKILYPNTPVELVVSIGTGYTTTHSTLQSMGWDVLVNQLVASSTDTEDVHALLRDFLPPDKYFRFNPVLPDAVRIDEKDRTALSRLKEVAAKHIAEVECGPNKAHFAQLLRLLRGK